MNAIYEGATFYGNTRAMIPIKQQIQAYVAGLTTSRHHEKKRVAGETPDVFATVKVSAPIARRLAAIGTTPQTYGLYMDALQAKDMTIKQLAGQLRLKRGDVADQIAKLLDAKFIRLAGTAGVEFVWQWI